MHSRCGMAFVLFLGLSACLPIQPGPAVPPTLTPTASVLQPKWTATAFPTPSPSPSPIPTTTPAATPSAQAAPLPSPAKICAPLEDIDPAKLDSPDLLKNPYLAARAGYDDGHPGIDLAYWSLPNGQAMLGQPVLSSLDGIVAGVLPERQPFGHALIIETPLERLPASWPAQIKLPLPQAHLQASYSLSCPDLSGFNASTQSISIYTLYAHLNRIPLVHTGEAVSCGQAVGEVGTSGKSVNPHLHLEMRSGPSGQTFASLGHYDTAATPAEMHAYCLWRISGAFPSFDPLNLFSLVLPEH